VATKFEQHDHRLGSIDVVVNHKDPTAPGWEKGLS
jgi:hypothetical protein